MVKTQLKSIRAGKHVSDQHFVQSQNFNFIALLFFFLVFLPYHWSSWTVYVQQWHWLKGFLLLGTNYDRAWLYDLSLQHPPTLWARSEGSSVSIADLHCTLRADSHHDRKLYLKKYSCISPFDLTVEHIANFWQQVCMACSLLHQCQSCLKHRLNISLSDLPGCKHKAISKY